MPGANLPARFAGAAATAAATKIAATATAAEVAPAATASEAAASAGRELRLRLRLVHDERTPLHLELVELG